MNSLNVNKIWLLIPFICFALLSCDKDEEEKKEDIIAQMKKNKEEGEAFLSSLKNAEGIISDDRGCLFRINSKGSGKKPDANDSVQIAYVGKRIDGKVFEEVEKQVCMDELMEGLHIGIRYMSEGSNHTIYLPYYLMYGSSGKIFYGESDTVSVEAYSALIYEMELKKVVNVE